MAAAYTVPCSVEEAIFAGWDGVGGVRAFSVTPIAGRQLETGDQEFASFAFRHGLQVFVDDEHFHAGVGGADRDEAEFAFAGGSFGIPSIEGAGNREFRRAVEIFCGRVRRRLNEALYDL